ncbi:carcinoembryonic antigen-related cell adhesion molecule 1 [Xyrichtys novacula]|uniref:Carcinoembryonic antigen-related cell adhesion molecule 1 n=1 Tax=Xyrichtys novacula TaxID=13765 RepID=A0AAV1FN83_XYRNO|nr:carcinoembryonic antigen-related cell adhesion molecule 1 [Xyrichtys novacula]
MESPVVSVLILAVITFYTVPSCGQKIMASQNPLPVGSTVTLSTDANVSSGVWLFENDIIVFIILGIPTISDSWSSRVTFNSTTSSLTIRSLQLQDTGIYKLEALNTFSAELTLNVQEPISSVTLEVDKSSLVEFNDTAVLMCSVSNGSSLTYVWTIDDSVITPAEDVEFSDEGATLTLVDVIRQFEGEFKCIVSNLLGQVVSSPVDLTVSYGPSNPLMEITPMGSYHRTGSNITLSCSAESSHPAPIVWMVNDTYLENVGPQLQLEMVTKNDSGYYECLFHNTATMRFSSASAMIRVVKPIEAIHVKNQGGPAILDEDFTLLCEVTGSEVTAIHWWKDQKIISAFDSMVLDNDNKTLTLTPAQLSDKGDYQCLAFNEVSELVSSSYTVEINFGPTMPTITGPKIAFPGDNITLTCNATSHPPSSYAWFFNDTIVAVTSEYVLSPLTFNMSGMYTCMALNHITFKNITVHKTLTVVDPIHGVNIEMPDDPAIEGDVFMLTCDVTGPAEYVVWMKHELPLLGDDRMTFSTDNKTVTFNPIHRNDTGEYICIAFNAFIYRTSLPFMLKVAFGPDAPHIKAPYYGETGRQVDLECSAHSMPPSQYTWWYNGSEVAFTSVFRTKTLQLNMSGEYTCMAYNNVTGEDSTISHKLTVIEAIESLMITSDEEIPIDTKDFTLTCEVTGPYDSLYWRKNDVDLNMHSPEASNMSYYSEGNMLHFTPLTRDDDGIYECVATNKAASHVSKPYTLLGNYGPLSMSILTLDTTLTGPTVYMKCFADSRPECKFSWFFNTFNEPLMEGSLLKFSVTNETNGTYICMAKNPVTNITMFQFKNFTGHADGLHAQSKTALLMMGLLALFANVISI